MNCPVAVTYTERVAVLLLLVEGMQRAQVLGYVDDAIGVHLRGGLNVLCPGEEGPHLGATGCVSTSHSRGLSP
jgi:hypothetical protein